MAIDCQTPRARYRLLLAAVGACGIASCDPPQAPPPVRSGDVVSTDALGGRTADNAELMDSPDVVVPPTIQRPTQPAEVEVKAALASTSEPAPIFEEPLFEDEPSGFRTWTSRSGNSKLDAKLVGYDADFVVLERIDGSRLRVRVENLSIADRKSIADGFGATESELFGQEEVDPLVESGADISLRNDDFPRTYIESIAVDLTSPQHSVRLTWSGPEAEQNETGPFYSSPGGGLGHNDCDNVDESRRDGSNCTPKGEHLVEGFSDLLPSYPHCKFVTWFDKPRQIAFHSHSQVPRYPASHGCVRLDRHAAQLIHNNSRIGKTRVTVDGTWSRW